MREWFRLFGLSVKVKFENFLEYMKVIRRYYHNRDFRRADISLLSKYLFQNPFKMSSRFLQSKGFDEIYAYGETPLTTLEEIAKISSKDRKSTRLNSSHAELSRMPSSA